MAVARRRAASTAATPPTRLDASGVRGAGQENVRHSESVNQLRGESKSLFAPSDRPLFPPQVPPSQSGSSGSSDHDARPSMAEPKPPVPAPVPVGKRPSDLGQRYQPIGANDASGAPEPQQQCFPPILSEDIAACTHCSARFSFTRRRVRGFSLMRSQILRLSFSCFCSTTANSVATCFAQSALPIARICPSTPQAMNRSSLFVCDALAMLWLAISLASLGLGDCCASRQSTSTRWEDFFVCCLKPFVLVLTEFLHAANPTSAAACSCFQSRS